jgi:predicted RNA binding protein YcfA (HicA-like mRNA interferase family)
MPKLPVDAPIRKVMKALESLGFALVREGNHIAMIRQNYDGTKTPLTIPNHRTLKSSTLRAILTQAGIAREDFLKAYYKKQ